jgi:myo-inositol-1(or 4)-monophosphatase
MTEYVDLLPVASEAVDLASQLMRTHQPGVLTAKGDRDMASEVDYAIERKVRAVLRQRTPDIGFLGEEAGADGPVGELTWALDPVDGTANFVHGLPMCGVSLGLLRGDRPVLGLIDLPFLGTRYSAVEGHGAHANGSRLRASRTSRLSEAIVAIGDYAVGPDATRKNALRLAVTSLLAAQAQRVRMHGSAATDLAWLAAGKIDALIILSNKPWDMAAGVVIAREAGAHVVDVNRSAHTTASAVTLGAGEPLIEAVVTLVRDAGNEPAVAASP